MNSPRLFPALLGALFTIAASSSMAELTPQEIDNQLAVFNEQAPKEYYEQRVLMAKEVAPFLNRLDAPQLRDLCQRLDAGNKMQDRIVRHAAWRIGKLEGERGLTFFKKHTFPKLRQQVASALSGWAQVDPQAAVEWVLEHHGEGRILIDLVDNMYSNKEALAKIMALPGLQNTKARLRGMRFLGQDIIRRSPREGLQWFVNLPKRDQALLAGELLPQISPALPEETARLLPSLPMNWKRWGIIGTWALTQPEAVMKWAAGLSEETLKRDGRWITLAIWTDIDPFSAWSALLALPAPEVETLLKTRSESYRGFLETGGRGGTYDHNLVYFNHYGLGRVNSPKEDRPQIARQIGSHYRGKARAIGGESLHQVMWARLPTAILPKVITRAQASPHKDLTANLQHMLAQRKAAEDPTAVDNLLATFGNEDKASTAIEVFANRHPEKALPLTMKLVKRRESSIRSILYRWVRYEPDGAKEHVESLPEGELRTLAVKAYQESIKSYRIRNSLTEAKAAFEALPLGSSERNSAFNRYLSMLLKLEDTPVEQIYKEIDVHFKTQKFNPRRNPLSHDIVPSLVKRNPEALARWAKTLPESNLRHRALRSFWELWETYGAGEGVRRLEKLGIAETEIRSSRY